MTKESNPITVVIVVALICGAIYAGVRYVQGPQVQVKHEAPTVVRPPEAGEEAMRGYMGR